jgi:hypothetical protein
MVNRITYQEWWQCAKLYKKELIHVFSILVIIVLCGIFVVSQSFLLCEEKTETMSVQPTDTDIFSQAKAEYEANTGKKIYPAGERCLRNAAAQCTTKEQVYAVIVQNMK